MACSAKIVGDELVLRIPMNAKPEKSSSGKTPVVACTYGNKETGCVVDGKKVIVGVNAHIPEKMWRGYPATSFGLKQSLISTFEGVGSLMVNVHTRRTWTVSIQE